jgi:protein-tyrosine-phosphatase
MAEAIARSEAWDVINPLSAGIAPLGFVVRETLDTLQANGFSIEDLKSKPLNEALWKAAQVVVNMTGRPKEIAFRGFPAHAEVEEWRVRDPYGESNAFYQEVCEELQGRVQALAERLRSSG